jgi:hypothetical protein
MVKSQQAKFGPWPGDFCPGTSAIIIIRFEPQSEVFATDSVSLLNNMEDVKAP